MPNDQDMPSLKTVLATTKREIFQTVTEIDSILRQAIELLIQAANPYPKTNPEGKRWAYSWGTDDDHYSVSTQAMCAVAVDGLLADKEVRFAEGQASRLKDARDSVTTLLFKRIGSDIASGRHAWESTTFGDDDIFTATWLKQLLSTCPQEDRRISERVTEIIGQATKGTDFTERPLFSLPSGNDAGPHALPLLRVIEAVIDEPSDSSTHDAIERAGNWFDKNLYRQTSYFRFSDFRFDAAELIFCLSGVLATKHLGRFDTLIGDVLKIVREAQQRSVYWRPYRPMVSNNKGGVLLPLSIEVASVLLEVLEETKTFDTFGDTLRDYYRWLVNQRVMPGVNLTGWHSENTYISDTIHIWDTARIAVFLSRYRAALTKSLHREVLASSQFTSKAPKEILTEWERIVPFDLGAGSRTFEQVASTVGNEQQQKDFSLLLYGPPGVSKTTIARAIAKRANRRLIELTPSDFLSEGEAEVEARAKNVFAALMCLKDSIVFFDEIDELILDRNSKAYGRQQGIFKFMTPGMLTKLQDLRDYRQVSFIIATNYADHVDGAIKRGGRIDRQILCLPPNKTARKEQLKRLIDPDGCEEAWGAESDSLLEQLAMKTALFAYQDLRAMVAPFVGTQGGAEGRRASILASALTSTMPAPKISLHVYEDRLKDADYPQKPYDEYLHLLLLKVEVGSEKEKGEFAKVLASAKGRLPEGEYGETLARLRAAAEGTDARGFADSEVGG